MSALNSGFQHPTTSSHAANLRSRFGTFALFLLFALLTYPHGLFAQSSKRLDSLYAAQSRLDREIRFLTVARDSAHSQKENTFAELQLINKQVVLREQLLGGLQSQMTELDKEIETLSSVIISLEEDIERIKTEFGKLMVVTYKAFGQKNSSFYLLSAESVGQGYKRMQYFQAISRMQASQMKLAKRTKAFLEQKKILLDQRKVEKQKVVQTERIERQKMVVLKDQQRHLYEKLKSDEAKFAADIQTNQKEKEKLSDEIKKELKRISDAKNAKIKTAPKKEVDIINALNKDFATNKGSFPWPIPMPNASVTRHFGRQTMPGSNVQIDVQGIDLTTLPNQAVRSVFAGEVESVMTVPGQGKMVIISHGTYYTVFANLGTVNVKAHEKVGMLSTIGTVRTDPATGESKLYFQMNQDKSALDPESWLVKKK